MFGRRSQQPEEALSPPPAMPAVAPQPAHVPHAAPAEPSSPAAMDFDGVLVNTEVREVVRERKDVTEARIVWLDEGEPTPIEVAAGKARGK